MRVLPTSCGDLVLPEECQDGAFLIADCLVDIGMSALTPFAPAISGMCAPFIGFVTFADVNAPADECNQLTVAIDQIAPTKLGGTAAMVCAGFWRVRYRVDAVFADFPTIQRIEDSIYLPSVQSIENSARWLYAIGVALTQAYAEEISGPSCAGIQAASNRQMTPVTPSGPRGGCAGWRTTITVDI